MWADALPKGAGNEDASIGTDGTAPAPPLMRSKSRAGKAKEFMLRTLRVGSSSASTAAGGAGDKAPEISGPFNVKHNYHVAPGLLQAKTLRLCCQIVDTFAPVVRCKRAVGLPRFAATVG